MRGRLSEIGREIAQCKRRHGPRARATERKIEKRKNLQTKDVEWLEWHLHSVRRSLRFLDTTLNAAIHSYACSSCHTLTSAIQTSLPREIRDMVYDELVDPETASFIGDQVQWQVKRGDFGGPPDASSFELPHFISPPFVPHIVSMEIMQLAAVKYSRGKRRCSEWTESYHRFLSMRALAMDFPVMEFFRDVKIDFYIKSMFKAWEATQKRRVDDMADPEWVAHVRKLVLCIPERRDRRVIIEIDREELSDLQESDCKRALDPIWKQVAAKEFRSFHVAWKVDEQRK